MRGREVPWPILEHWWLCGRKRPYATRTIAELAQQAAFIALRGRVESLNPYECPLTETQGLSPHWHVGHRQALGRRPSQVRQQAISAWNRFVDRHPRWGAPEVTP